MIIVRLGSVKQTSGDCTLPLTIVIRQTWNESAHGVLKEASYVGGENALGSRSVCKLKTKMQFWPQTIINFAPTIRYGRRQKWQIVCCGPA